MLCLVLFSSFQHAHTHTHTHTHTKKKRDVINQHTGEAVESDSHRLTTLVRPSSKAVAAIPPTTTIHRPLVSRATSKARIHTRRKRERERGGGKGRGEARLRETTTSADAAADDYDGGGGRDDQLHLHKRNQSLDRLDTSISVCIRSRFVARR